MLSSETKRRIDSCRDILVGQLPLPTDQVELITLALIYKFMDDLDEQSVQLGGKRSFFIKDLADFRWRSLMPQTVSAADRVRLFADGLEALGDPKTGKHLPEMFRDIFRNAMLKFRDGRILSLFLTELDGFAYSHSEELGNAFEYLLQSMGAQGDNGQFRTPRHIIDFIVEVLEPKPEDKILDPACGTGGFLVSAYKHILGKHTSKGSSVPGDQLSPAKKEKLTQHLNGYDITPMMVKLSKVNMFLHGFSDPQIHEYDTLSNDARWNEKYDLIMANPPFMTPKGGVVPHTKFRIAAKKAEVLFTDYIAEHLSTNGRAGIIVPEGIIFQSATAYKALRKFLVEDSLVAVISLPAGVFSPYSLVKTSILILDKGLARQSDSIAFFKVENDGYDLGAQRRAIDKNDLPRLTKEIHEYLGKVRSGKKNADKEEMHIVPKEKIAASGEYNLGGERYRESKAEASEYIKISLGEACEVYQPKTITQQDLKPNGEYLVYGANGVIGRYDKYNHEDAEVIVTCRGATCGTLNFSQQKAWITGNAMVVKPKGTNLLKEFLYLVLKSSDLTATITGSAQPQITRQSISPFQIPLPSLETQKEIVAEIQGFQKVIDGARAVVENYKPQIPIDQKWPLLSLGDICIKCEQRNPEELGRQTFQYIDIESIDNDALLIAEPKLLATHEAPSRARKLVRAFDVLFSTVRPYLKNIAMVPRELDGEIVSTGFAVLRADPSRVMPEYLFAAVASQHVVDSANNLTSGASYPAITENQLFEIKITVPPLELQKTTVADLKKEQAMVNANRELIVRFEKKIQAVMDRVWGNGTAE